MGTDISIPTHWSGWWFPGSCALPLGILTPVPNRSCLGSNNDFSAPSSSVPTTSSATLLLPRTGTTCLGVLECVQPGAHDLWGSPDRMVLVFPSSGIDQHLSVLSKVCERTLEGLTQFRNINITTNPHAPTRSPLSCHSPLRQSAWPILALGSRLCAEDHFVWLGFQPPGLDEDGGDPLIQDLHGLTWILQWLREEEVHHHHLFNSLYRTSKDLHYKTRSTILKWSWTFRVSGSDKQGSILKRRDIRKQNKDVHGGIAIFRGIIYG